MRKRRLTELTGIACLALAVLASPADAASKFSSTYEHFHLEKCATIEEAERSELLLCAFSKGPDLAINWHEHGVDVMIAAHQSEGRYEPTATNFKVSRTGHFGGIWENKTKRSTVEWRVKQQGGKWVPFAAIIRTNYADFATGDAVPRERLDVIKFGDDHACQAGTVESTVKNHYAKARGIADAVVDTNPCPQAQ